jgi:kumamolisin
MNKPKQTGKKTTVKKSAKPTHVKLEGSHRGKDPDARKIGEVNPRQHIAVTIGLAGPKLPTANDAIGQTLPPQEFAKRYSASQADADKVAVSLKKFGLKVDSIFLPARIMKVSGTAKAMEAAFHPHMVLMHSKQDGDYRGRTGRLQIPAELQSVVTGVFGLDQRRMARRAAKSMSTGKTTLAPMSPAALEQRYNFPPGNAAGQNIAIAEFGGGYIASDAQAYCAKYGRPMPNIVAQAVDAPAYTLAQMHALPAAQQTPALQTSAEVMMDVEIIAGLCSGANITVYFSSFDQRGWVDLLSAVIAAPPVALACSWGAPEEYSGWSPDAIAAIDDRLNALRLLGVTACICAGDDGSGDQLTDGKYHVHFPGSSANALSVGGTMLTGSGNAVEEVTWWVSPGQRNGNGGGATGGGVSTLFPRPQWQKVKVKSLNAGAKAGRVTPDIAALSGPPNYDLILLGQSAPNGGTSASTQLWASLIARLAAGLPASKKQRFLTPLLYQPLGNSTVGAVATRDITVGNNASLPEPGKGYKAKAGFDACTGWGVPDGAKLQEALAQI